MKRKFKLPNGKIVEREVKVINPNPLDDFASVKGITGESIQGTYKG